MNVSIYQGNETLPLVAAEVTVVIDVIRAFTTSEVAFSKGVDKILMVKDTTKAFDLREGHPELLLMGEVDAHPIPGFDFDNSPWRLHQSDIDITGKTLVQRTTNGVKAVVNNFNPRYTFVTGFSNALSTAVFIKEHISASGVNLIASHPSSDEDMACAEYMKALIEDEGANANDFAQRILDSSAAQKFFNGSDIFLSEDIALCAEEKVNNLFVMEVNRVDETLVMTKTEY
ncbi:MAG: 2-phosphosulfolactate phosphatase [Pseudomonadota bacterium]